MKVISFDIGRSTWLFPLEEFAPSSGSNSVSIVEHIATKYGFSIVPKISTRDDMSKNGLHFGMGSFQHDGQHFSVSDFMVYNDGLVAVSEKTEWSDAFLNDVIKWVQTDFGFRSPATGIHKLYSSNLVI